MGIKLNVGASPIWAKDGWTVLDHKASRSTEKAIKGDAAAMDVADGSCSHLFCSHMLEHIPHFRVQKILLEFSRVLNQEGILRIIVPDLRKIAQAYVNRDHDFFDRATQEDEKIRKDLGLGGMFMNFIVSPGQDTILIDRNLKEFVGGYAHLYAYDFEMLEILLKGAGFHKIKQMEFGESIEPEFEEPLHVEGMPAKWQTLNRAFFEKNGLRHHYKDGKYDINFKLTGFDAYPTFSLIIEAQKEKTIRPRDVPDLNQAGNKNFNHYGGSLLHDAAVATRLEELGISRMAKS